MTVTGNPCAAAPLSGAGAHIDDIAPPELLDLCGLLTIQLGMRPTGHEASQLEQALRQINGTEIGAQLLRDIAACDIPPAERPAFIFENDDPYDDGASAFEYPALTGAYLIYFNTSPGADAADGAAPDAGVAGFSAGTATPAQARAVQLFCDLAAFYADQLGQASAEPALGFGPYSAIAFRAQLGMQVPQWQWDVEAWIQAPAADPDEHRGDVWERLCAWHGAGNSEVPLALVSLGLRECPPLQNVPGLRRLVLADNRIAAFPPAERLPSGITTVDLAGNPISAGAARYGENLTQVAVDEACFRDTQLHTAFPSRVEVIRTDANHVRRLMQAVQIMTQFPETLAGIAPIEPMERAGWTNEVMADLYDADLLEKAVTQWLAPAPASASWRRAQEADPNAAFAMTALLNRLQGIPQYGPGRIQRERFVALLAKMQEPGKEPFLADCLAIARNGAESCQDRILDTLNDLHVASLNADVEAGDYDARPLELLHLGEDMFALHTLAQFTARLMPDLKQRARAQGKRIDEVEQFLALRTRLQGKAFLPPLQFDMQFASLSLVTDDDVERAAAAILRERETRYTAFLASWSPLLSVIRRTAPHLLERADRWRDYIYSDRGRVYGWLDRLLRTDGRLFSSKRRQGDVVFNVEPSVFWTRYERMVDRHMTAQTGPRDDVRAAAAADEEIRTVIHEATVRAFLDMHNLKLSRTIMNTREPRWFKRVRKRVA
jgi:hypothetical protein